MEDYKHIYPLKRFNFTILIVFVINIIQNVRNANRKVAPASTESAVFDEKP